MTCGRFHMLTVLAFVSWRHQYRSIGNVIAAHFTSHNILYLCVSASSAMPLKRSNGAFYFVEHIFFCGVTFCFCFGQSVAIRNHPEIVKWKPKYKCNLFCICMCSDVVRWTREIESLSFGGHIAQWNGIRKQTYKYNTNKRLNNIAFLAKEDATKRNERNNFASRVKVCNGNWNNTYANTRGTAAPNVVRLLPMDVKYAFVLFGPLSSALVNENLRAERTS